MVHILKLIVASPVSLGVGWLVGCFTPGISRKVKGLFVKESTAIIADIKKKV